MSVIRCFLLEPSGVARLSLRRYRWNESAPCHTSSLHNAEFPFGAVQTRQDDRGIYVSHEELKPDASDPRWPSACECGYVFTAEDPYQLFEDHLWRRADNGELVSLRDAPAGAMWYADWYNDWHVGPDGRCLVVKTPGGEWIIDSEASNCTRKGDKSHRCWIRHGTPPLITVDKNGDTCAAGAGSILAGSYHGFLISGELRQC